MRVRYASAPPTIVVPGGAVHSQRPCDQIACAPPARAMMRSVVTSGQPAVEPPPQRL